MSRTGFPWADIANDGSSVIGKHEATGGEVSIGTVTSQLLYEIGSPSYLGPDVTARFDTLELKQVSPDRVLIENVKGEPPPETLKVSMNKLGGLQNRHVNCFNWFRHRGKGETRGRGILESMPS